VTALPGDAPLRIGVLGCGAALALHLPAIETSSRTTVSAVIDVDEGHAASAARRSGAPAFSSLADGIASGTFDAVLVLLPHHLHEAAAVAALDSGCHVLLEKPIAATIRASEHILDVARRVDRVLMIAENAQFWPEVVLAKRLLDDGRIGEVVTGRAWHCLPPIGDFLAGEDPWRLSRERTGGGVAIDAGSHWLRPLRMWLGELVEVVAVTGRPYPAMEAESMCRALCRFDTGVVASFDVLLPPGPGVAPTPLFQITGSTGEIVIESGGRVKLYDGTEPRGTVAGTGSYLESYVHQLAAFEAAVLDGVELPVPPEYALGELRGALAMYRSAESRKWEPVW
jgi:predicted dehydrogenase